MKKINILVSCFVLFLSSLLYGQSEKHLWQLPKYPPVIKFNQNGQMSVFTYDRLSIYNVETGALEKTFDLLTNRNPYIWPTTTWVDYTQEFKTYRFYGQNKNLSGNRGVFVRFDAEEGEWREAASYDYPIYSYRGLDIHGNDIVKNWRKPSIYTHKPKGKKLKEIAKAKEVHVLQGGRFASYNEDNQLYVMDFTSESSKSIAVKGFGVASTDYPEWFIIKDGDNRTLYNPYTNQTEVKSLTEKFKDTPSKYVNCIGAIQDAIYYGDYIYQTVIDDAAAETPDPYGAVAYKIAQYKASDCSLVKMFDITVSESENASKSSIVAPIYEGVKLMDEKYQAESQARKDLDAKYAQKNAVKKEAAELAKELFINFRDGGQMYSFSLSSLEGRDISNLPYTKKYLTHLKGEIYAIVQFSCGTSKILVVAVRNGNTTNFKFLKLHYEGAYQYTRDIDGVNISGSVITQNLSIGLTNMGYSIKADVNRTYLATGKVETSRVYAPCSGEWK